MHHGEQVMQEIRKNYRYVTEPHSALRCCIIMQVYRAVAAREALGTCLSRFYIYLFFLDFQIQIQLQLKRWLL